MLAMLSSRRALRPPLRLVALVLAPVVAGSLLAACGGTVAGTSAVTSSTAGPTSSAASASTATSSTAAGATTTTTTLPHNSVLAGTAPWGPVSPIGSVHRVPVVPLGQGALLPPAPPPGGTPPGDEVTIAYRRLGSGPDLLLVAGEHATMTTWDPRLLLTLAQHYRVTIFDLPGVGYSGSPLGAASVASFADVTAGLVDAIGLVQPTILGWGLGGEIALAAAERHPGIASHVVVADSSAGGPGVVPSPPGVATLLASGALTVEQLAGVLFPGADATVRAAWVAAIREYAPDDLVASAAGLLAAVQQAAWSDPSVSAGLAAIGVPVLVVRGSEDGVFPAHDTKLLLAGLRHAHLLELAAAGYGAIFQDASSFVPALETFTG